MTLSNKPYGFIYKTVLPDGRYYLGQHKIISHSTMDLTYFGSGVIIKDYIKKYGKTCLTREILKFGYSFEEMNLLEKEYITETILNDPLNINLDLGGKNKFTRHSDVCKKIGKTISKLRKENPSNWKIRTGKENNKSINWKLISPNGVEYITCGGLKTICENLGLSVNTLKLAYKEGWIPRRGVCAGWKIFNMDTGKGTNRDTRNHGEYIKGLNNPWFKFKRGNENG